MKTYIYLVGQGCAEHEGPCACEIEWLVDVEAAVEKPEGGPYATPFVDIYYIEAAGRDDKIEGNSGDLTPIIREEFLEIIREQVQEELHEGEVDTNRDPDDSW